MIPCMTIARYKSNRNVVYSCKYHVVFCPKYRRKVLTELIQKDLRSIILEICKTRQAEIIAMELMPDHVHILLEVDPQYHPSLRSRLPTLWTNSYFVSTVGGAPLSVIKQYVENQKAV